MGLVKELSRRLLPSLAIDSNAADASRSPSWPEFICARGDTLDLFALEC